MAKDVSAIVSGMGVALALVEGICKRVKKLGGTDEDIHRLVTDQGEDVLDQIAHLIVGGKEKTKLLKLATTVSLPAIGRFVACDHFQVGEHNGVKIAWLGDNFKEHFLNKVEESVGAAELKIHKLLQPSLDPPIIAVLGDRHETTLAHIWSLLKLQPHGEAGALLTNGYTNIFYVRDVANLLWAVDVYWSDDGWSVRANSIERPDGWGAGRRVCSR